MIMRCVGMQTPHTGHNLTVFFKNFAPSVLITYCHVRCIVYTFNDLFDLEMKALTSFIFGKFISKIHEQNFWYISSIN